MSANGNTERERYREQVHGQARVAGNRLTVEESHPTSMQAQAPQMKNVGLVPFDRGLSCLGEDSQKIVN